ncbi:MAG: exonuclease domain-containing protein [Clostridia bacterium]|nr:exonuclease domain-containing protein [Clostridia bacterium]
MHYITLDLEWNQAYAQKALAVQRQLSCRLRGEVIQIGAVKLDKNMNVCGSYQIIVKPKYFKKLHRHVSELTGITQQQMDMGTPLDEAAERFRSWCGKDYAFLTWGPDDIPMLRENLNASGISQDWIGEVYDLQKIFNTRTDGLAKQRSLEYAMDYFGIQQTLPAHDALNDAYFTALVAMHLDVPDAIKSYTSSHGDFLEEEVIGDADAGDDGYVTIEEMLEDDIIKHPLCPTCHAPLTEKGDTLHSKGQKYTFYFTCQQDGDMLITLRLHRNFNDTWRAKRIVRPADEASLKSYKEGLIKHESFKKKSTKKRRTRFQKSKKETVTAG